MKPLPGPDELFNQYFAPIYHAEDLEHRGLRGIRAEAQRISKIGQRARDISRLTPLGIEKASSAIIRMTNAAEQDFRKDFSVEGPLSAS